MRSLPLFVTLAGLWAGVAQADEISVRVSSAATSLNINGQPAVNVTLDAAGTRRFAEFTAHMIGATVFIYAGDELLVAPTIMDAITAGQFQISSGPDFDQQAADDLASSLNDGGRLTVTDAER